MEPHCIGPKTETCFENRVVCPLKRYTLRQLSLCDILRGSVWSCIYTMIEEFDPRICKSGGASRCTCIITTMYQQQPHYTYANSNEEKHMQQINFHTCNITNRPTNYKPNKPLISTNSTKTKTFLK